MRVGVVEHAPWTTLTPGGGAGGLEAALMAELARELGARLQWVRGPESSLLEALQLRELDVVIGGLTDASPWKKQVAFTKPFYTDTIVVGQPPGMPPVQTLERRIVAVKAGEPSAGYVRKKGGVPMQVPDLGHAVGLLAAPTWQLTWYGLVPAGVTLHQARHVIAAPPGENAWLLRIEAAIRGRKAVIPELLRTLRS
jgi:polar amino acid transport system substrate-binding protein